jgi:hypothetical protein
MSIMSKERHNCEQDSEKKGHLRRRCKVHEGSPKGGSRRHIEVRCSYKPTWELHNGPRGTEAALSSV